MRQTQSRSTRDGSALSSINGRTGGSVAVQVRLVRALDRDAEVAGLLGRQRGETDTERAEVQTGDLLVEVLGERVHAVRVSVVGRREQLELREDLVRERVRHHERGVASRVAE